MTRQFRFAAVFFLAILPVAGCGKDPQVARVEYLQRGDSYFAQKKYPEAVIEYRNAIQQDPRYGEARFKLAETYMQTGDAAGAFREYVRAADLLPENAEAQIKAGHLLLLAGQFEEAQARADRSLKLEPKNVQAQLVLALSLAGLKKYDQAVSEIEQAIATDPRNSGSYQSLGRVERARGRLVKAEDAFKKAVETEGNDSIVARLALGNFYISTGRAEAQQMFKDAVRLRPQDAEANRALAMWYFSRGLPDQGEPYLKTFANVSPGGAGKLNLASYYVSRQKLDEAQKILESVDASNADTYNSAQLGLADLAVRRNDKARATTLIDGVLKRQGTHPDALVARAELLARDGKVKEAQTTAQLAVDANPSSARAQFALARLREAAGQMSEALAAYTEAAKLAPALAGPDYEAGRVSLALGRMADAKQFATSALRKSPGYIDAAVLLARVNTMQGDYNAADTLLRQLRTRPEAPVQIEVGRLELARNNRPGARAAFEKALVARPGDAEALSSLIVLDFNEQRPDAAKARLNKALQQNPRDAGLLVVAARTHGTLRDLPAAEEALKTAISVDPARLEAYGMLGQLYASQGKLDQAIAEFQRLVEHNPTSVPGMTMIGMLLESQNKRAEARKQYEHVIGIDARAPVAANNLAWIYADEGTNLDVALTLAQTAKSVLPKSGEVTDTLGWVLYKKGLHRNAIGAFQEAIQQQPANATFKYHLGFAYAKNGDVDAARTTLSEALKAEPNNPQSQEARTVISRLSTGG